MERKCVQEMKTGLEYIFQPDPDEIRPLLCVEETINSAREGHGEKVRALSRFCVVYCIFHGILFQRLKRENNAFLRQ